MPMPNSKLQAETRNVESADLLKPLQITENPTNCKAIEQNPQVRFDRVNDLSQWVRIAMRLNFEPTNFKTSLFNF